jgi:hypothetical protein
MELLRLPPVNILTIPDIPKHLNIITPLSVLPYGLGILHTLSRLLSGK